jgi:polyphosphate kinase 2 (PPK2 family)
MNLLERKSSFDARVKAKYKPTHAEDVRDYYEKYIRSTPRYALATAFDFNHNRDYISFYFEEFKTEEDKKQYIKDCIYTVLIK